MNVTITLERQRLDYIINVLAQRPYSEVAETLSAIALQLQQSPPAPHAGNGAAHDAPELLS
jgi:hypothetical protein